MRASGRWPMRTTPRWPSTLTTSTSPASPTCRSAPRGIAALSVLPLLMQPLALPLQALDATCLPCLSLQDRLEMEEEETGARSPLITFSHFLPHQVPLFIGCANWSCCSLTGAQLLEQVEMLWREVALCITCWCAVFCTDAWEQRAREMRRLTKSKQCAALSVRGCCGSRCYLRNGCCSSQIWPRRRAATTSQSV